MKEESQPHVSQRSIGSMAHKSNRAHTYAHICYIDLTLAQPVAKSDLWNGEKIPFKLENYFNICLLTSILNQGMQVLESSGESYQQKQN